MDRDEKEIVAHFHNHPNSWVWTHRSINNYLVLGDASLTLSQYKEQEEKTAQGESRFTRAFTHLSSIEQLGKPIVEELRTKGTAGCEYRLLRLLWHSVEVESFLIAGGKFVVLQH